MNNYYLEEIKKQQGQGKGKVSPSFSKMRTLAKKNLENKGFPDRKNEDWKFSSSTKFIGTDFHFNGTHLKAAILSPEEMALVEKFQHRLVFINGELEQSLNFLPDNIELVSTTADAIDSSVERFLNIGKKEEAFDSLNLLGLDTVHALHVKANTSKTADAPLALLCFYKDSNKNTFSPRLVIDLAKGARLDLFSGHWGENEENNSYLLNSVTQINLEENARLEYSSLNQNSQSAKVVDQFLVDQKKFSQLNLSTLNLAGKFTRQEVMVNLNEEEANANFHSLMGLKGEQHCDSFITYNHFSERTFGEQLVKSLLDDSSHGVFTGKIFIHPNAQKVAAEQLNKTLLISDKAKIDTRPQLEVYADDVSCAHGATTGQLSDDEIFYFQSRGIPKERAIKMISFGFANDIIDKVENTLVKDILTQELFNHLGSLNIESDKESSHEQ
jgi:Fe-S cluster assembly protein SufD